MTPEKILQSNMLDILFEGKNKFYGAYELRSKYEGRLTKALVGTLTGIAFAGFSYLWATRHNENPIFISDVPDTRLTPVEVPKTIEQKTPKPIQTHQAKTVAYQQVRIVPDPQIQKPTTPTQDDISNAVIDNKPNDGNHVDDNQNLSGVHGDPQQGVVTRDSLKTIVLVEPKVWEKVEKMPEFPGGQAALMRFLQKNISSPDLEDEALLIVKAQFVIDAQGNIFDIQIIQSGGRELDNLVQKAIKKMPTWTPGEQNGKNVAVRFIQVVTFQGSSSTN